MGTAYPELFHLKSGVTCNALNQNGAPCAVVAHQQCRHCGQAVCGRHEDQHALCPVKVKR